MIARFAGPDGPSASPDSPRAARRHGLGRSGLEVTGLTLGAAPLGNFYRAMAPGQARAIVDTAWDLNIRTFDTAPMYGFGLGEHRLGSALDGRPTDERVVSTKVGRVMRRSGRSDRDTGLWIDPAPFEAHYDYSYDGVMRSIEDSMCRLMVDRLEIALIHDIDVAHHGADQPSRFKEAIEGGHRALLDLKAAGVVRAIGVGVNETAVCVEFMKHADVDCFLVAGRYTLLEQDSLDDFLPMCAERSIGVILGGVFNSGILAQGPVDGARFNFVPAPEELVRRTREIYDICTRHEVSPRAVALQFAAAHPAVSSLCVGVSAPEQLRSNVELMDVTIPAELWSELEDAGHLRPDAPRPAETIG